MCEVLQTQPLTDDSGEASVERIASQSKALVAFDVLTHRYIVTKMTINVPLHSGSHHENGEL